MKAEDLKIGFKYAIHRWDSEAKDLWECDILINENGIIKIGLFEDEVRSILSHTDFDSRYEVVKEIGEIKKRK